VEFESIYAVSHPGRARLHGFGIFGGSNGYWRTDLLRRVRMHGFMLTEDIDSSLRVVQAGGKIAVDPALVSRELAPTTLHALWNQRMRWAQGWFQVSMKHLRRGWNSPALTLRQKLGFTFLLGWREIYPWLSIQIFPLMAFFAWKAGSVSRLDWLVPIFVLTTLFTLAVGPGQTYFAWRLAAPEIRRRNRWFLSYLAVSSLFYTEMKNVISRVAQIKEAMGDRQWTVTSRASAPAQNREAG
jgi:cellulose synthase/poly-beta-1,6-N-acetylglucosamine synthase-like glycosyltransferase